ncbi:hypothetical protein ASPSYDRAFT_92172 [Aspergillus sydowii CBS 593.65]|uniref:tRNA (uracil-O(2)-)-methyltransferase n=1 Tax=Aspergillus sydowii CBS 593.65 TaxID=1036612 RepID=A0A1L9T959_9EURO|nr:uncharacterized protein ASPSYDRAFT_92172 [Aspergillus sydowii CBS 593.65]OJJ55969.1 hypothetical protein ASPSYDRAFT_92172 [Aspergillus sydowii CBS 593.65]
MTKQVFSAARSNISSNKLLQILKPAMGRAKKSLRDLSRLSGRPLSETLTPSPVLGTTSDNQERGKWVTSPDLTEYGLPYPLEEIQSTTFFLIANPGLNSSVLFRADILSDSDAETETSQQAVESYPARHVPGFELSRVVARRLIPRNSQLDRPLEQTCHFYISVTSPTAESKPSRKRFLVVYTPHVSSKEELPYYHPRLQSLALLYECENTLHTQGSESASGETPQTNETEPGTGTSIMSIHFLPNPSESIHNRLERTLGNLLEVQIRVTRGRLLNAKAKSQTVQSIIAPIKDNVIPRHRVQDTYSRLKAKYAVDLCSRWVESTEPSKHVFEDLGVAAFLVELWRDMYGCIPTDEQQGQSSTLNVDDGPKQAQATSQFPGFVDIACGNGVLVYILLKEGYPGWGFDARRRKTWSIFADDIRKHLKEEIYIPEPFADALDALPIRDDDRDQPLSVSTSPGSSDNTTSPSPSPSPSLSTLHKNTFIISNHADELTLWTPLLAACLNPASPPPFLAIPCCSHALSGARYRYPAQTPPPTLEKNNRKQEPSSSASGIETGDLAALRKLRLTEQNPHSASFGTSTYGALTDKLVAISTEVGFDVLKTLLRIPSTRNIGVLGSFPAKCSTGSNGNTNPSAHANGESVEEARDRITAIVERECARDGGVYLSAKSWVDRAKGLRAGVGGNAHGH